MTILIVATLTAIISFVVGAIYGRRAEQAVIAEYLRTGKSVADIIENIGNRVKALKLLV